MMVSANKECAREPAWFESESAPDWLTLVIPFSDKIPEGKKGEDHGQYAKVHTGVQAAGRRAVQKVRHHLCGGGARAGSGPRLAFRLGEAGGSEARGRGRLPLHLFQLAYRMNAVLAEPGSIGAADDRKG